jgi:hypothetical protein
MMQPASPDPSPIYPEQDQMQTDNANEISSEHSEQPQIQISSPPHEPIQDANELSPDKLGDENVVCRWNNCMSPFNSHSSLANHLSEGTIFPGTHLINRKGYLDTYPYQYTSAGKDLTIIVNGMDVHVGI